MARKLPKQKRGLLTSRQIDRIIRIALAAQSQDLIARRRAEMKKEKPGVSPTGLFKERRRAQ